MSAAADAGDRQDAADGAARMTAAAVVDPGGEGRSLAGDGQERRPRGTQVRAAARTMGKSGSCGGCH